MDNELFQNTFKNIVLRLDNGTEMSFLGRQFAGGAWYDEETNILTRQHLYVTDTNEHIYSIVSNYLFLYIFYISILGFIFYILLINKCIKWRYIRCQYMIII